MTPFALGFGRSPPSLEAEALLCATRCKRFPRAYGYFLRAALLRSSANGSHAAAAEEVDERRAQDAAEEHLDAQARTENGSNANRGLNRHDFPLCHTRGNFAPPRLRDRLDEVSTPFRHTRGNFAPPRNRARGVGSMFRLFGARCLDAISPSWRRLRVRSIKPTANSRAAILK